MSSNKKPFCFVTKEGRIVSSNILSAFALKGTESKGLKDTFASQYGTYSITEPIYNPLSLSYILELNVYHLRCVQTKAKDTAGLGFDVTGKVEEDKNNAETIRETLANLPHVLNDTFYKACVDYETIGYACIEIIREDHKVDGELADLVHIPSIYVRVHSEGNKYLQMIGSQKRWFKKAGYPFDIHCETGDKFNLGELDEKERATELIFWANYVPRSVYYGVPDIIPALGAIQGDISRRDYNIAFFENYGIPAYAVYITGNYDPGDLVDKNGAPDATGKTQMEWEIERHFNDAVQNPNSVLILSIPTANDEGEVKVTFQPLSVETKESSFRLYRQDNRDEVLASHGVPPYRLGIVETGNLGSNVAEESTKIYKSSVIEPRQFTIETLINQFVLVGVMELEPGKFTFKISPIDVAEDEINIDLAVKLFQNGGMTPNDLIRNFGKKFGLKESNDEAMNLHYINGKPIESNSTNTDEIKTALEGLSSRLGSIISGEGQNTTGENNPPSEGQIDPSNGGEVIEE